MQPWKQKLTVHSFKIAPDNVQNTKKLLIYMESSLMGSWAG